MKKFFVGLVSIFVLLGATILTACGSNNIQMELSTQNIELQIRDEAISSTAEVTVTITGTDDSQVSVDARDSSDILSYTTQSLNNGQTIISITGISEGEGQVYVTSYQGNITKVINVVVYSQVSSMEQAYEETGKKNNFALRGGSVELIDSNLITFYPSQNSRRTITWDILDGQDNASIEGNLLTISPEFSEDTIYLTATTETGISCDIELPVIDNIDDDLSLSWSYSRDTQSYQQITEDNNTFTIVPNVPGELYTLYIKLEFNQDLDITSRVTNLAGESTDELIIEASGQDSNGNPIYSIYTNKNITNINENYVVYFEIGYEEYNLPSVVSMPIYIEVRETVSDIIISTGDGETDNIAGTTQILYSQYRNSFGREYYVDVIPTTVIGASREYTISVNISDGLLPEGGLSSGCPVEFWYQDTNNGNQFTQVVLEYDGNVYITRDENAISANRLYMKAASDLNVQSFDGIEITFRSLDNDQVTTTFNAQLVKSVSSDDFVFENADFRVDSSASSTATNITKTFTLQGQTTIDGLYIVNYSEHVTLPLTPTFVSSTADSVTFSITLTLNRSSYGVTSLDYYQICHENGLESEMFEIDIFLPLSEAVILYDTSNSTSSVTNYTTNNTSYDEDGLIIQSEHDSLSSIMLKNGTTTPILYSFNSSGNYEAEADIDISYYDFNETETFTIDMFKSLISTQEGVLQILANARANRNQISAIANFSADKNSIITSSVGFTYAVLSFTGQSTDDDGQTTIIKIVLIESYISPDGMSVTPSSDRQINLYSAESVSSRDSAPTSQTVTINFTNSNITYASMDNFTFISTVKDSQGNYVMGEQTVSGNSVSWENGRYAIEDIIITDSYIRFTIVTISNYGVYSFFDELEVHYQLLVDTEDGQEIMDMMWTTLNLTIRNAQRVTSLTWDNYDEDGIYLEVGDSEPYYLILSSSPTNARNTNVAYVITDQNGNVVDNDTFVGVDTISQDTLGISLSDRITQGTTGYIYLLPEDAVYNGNIIYYYYDGEDVVQSQVSERALGLLRSNGETWYDYLVNNAFFMSNTSLTTEAEIVYFSDILIKIEITVADGSSFDYAYRIYNEESFIGIMPNLYYTVMNSLDLPSDRIALETFSGGLQGYDDTITINLNGANFARELAESAIIRNIVFSGTVNGQGFIANENYGTIENVKVDVYQTYSSMLTYDGAGFVGGLVGINNGIITNSSVLGLTIDSQNSIIGGIAGQNNNIISGAKVEFYNLQSRQDDNTAYNTFIGNVVGGIVGQATEDSSIEYSYAYNYNIDSFVENEISVFEGNILGAIVGQIVGQTRIYISFGVIDNVSGFSGNVDDDMSTLVTSNSDFYWSYYNNGEYTSQFSNSNSSNLVSSGNGFLEYVNEGYSHYRDLYQEEKVTFVSGSVQTYQENGYYKSLAVDDSRGILFFYDVTRGSEDLSSSAENDLLELNTINLSQLLSNNLSENVIVTSSNNQVARVIGSTIILLDTGDITLTISSKHDVQYSKEINIKVIYAMSQMIISYTDSMDNTYQIEEGSTTYLQKTRSRQYTVNYENSTVLLGNTATRYSLVQNDVELLITIDNNTFDITQTNNIFIVSTSNDSTDGIIYIDQIVSDDEWQTAINDEFRRSFNISAVDGVISFSYTGESLPLTPSTNAAIRVEVTTTASNDSENLRPIIYNNGLELYISEKDQSLSMGDISVYHYTLPQDYSQNEDDYILTATITLLNRDSALDEETGVYNFIFEISFSVYVDYRSRIDRDIDFTVAFESNSGSNSSSVNGDEGQITLSLTRQNFTNIDVTSFKVDRSVWTNVDGTYYTAHQKGEQASVFSPGSSSILQITANPYFAHYDYVEISYSNVAVANAVDFELLQPYGSNYDTFISFAGADVYTYGNTLRFTPDRSLDYDYGTLYFRASISSSVDSDSIIRFNVSYYTSEGELLSQVNYYITINYLAQPTILVDGEQDAFIALGSNANVEIQVFSDQVLDSLTLEGEGLEGLNLSSFSEQESDSNTNIKTYSATISASVKASVASVNNTFTVHAVVRRTQNGVQETRHVYANVTLVDFKIDTSNVGIDGIEDGNLDVWQGVGKAFEVDYNILPESYSYDHNDSESVEKVSDLLNSRQEFEINQYYVSSKTDAETDEEIIQYAINYNYEEGRAYTLSERLFYIVNGNEEIPVTDEYRNSAGARFEFTTNQDGSQDAVIIGARQGEVVSFRLKTFIYTSNGGTVSYSTDFTVTVNVYSDEDLPLTISNATEFENLNPSNYTSGEITQNDYILTSDIVLENHSAFNTDLISSLDGNGYTIYIRSYNQSASGTLNLALFNNILSTTTLKNVRVNVYNGGQITVDLSTLSSSARINIAGLAITNEGIITNCEVVSFYTDGYASGTSDLLVPATVEHSNPSGFNVRFIRGANTTEEIYISDGSSWTPQIAGLVLQNIGNITNSRVGGDSVTILGEDRSVIDSSGNTVAMGYTFASEIDLDTFYIIGQGDMAGFVLINSGSIASSYAKLLDMENKSNSTAYDTSGFVGTNSGNVITSYVEGKQDESDTSESQKYAYTGTSLKSAYGIIAGFVNENTGTVKDSYSNILISNSSNALNVYLASGFVYINEGTIETSYSASQIANSRSTQMNFSGVNASGDLLANGNYINCYFFNASNYNNPDSSDNSNETLYDTGAVLITNPESSTYFYGFAIASSENDGIWTISDENGIKLIEPNIKSYSHRYISYIPDDQDYDGITGQDEQGRYVLPYAILQFTDSSREINTALGSENNPIIISNAQEFVEAMGTSQSSYTSQYFNSYSIWGTYRMVSNINLSDLSTYINLPSVSKAFSGKFYGNGFTISNLSIASYNAGVGYGLFASLESRNNSTPLISNLSLTIDHVTAGNVSMVGGVAGYAKDSILVNIDITFNDGAQISGLNFVGGLVGLSFGNSVIRNITVENPSVTAETYSNNVSGDYFTSSDITSIRNNIRNNLNNSTTVNSSIINTLSVYSYAGAVTGYSDHFVTMLNSFNINQAFDYTINNIRVNGTVFVQGQVAGGLFGLTSYQTNVRDAGLVITADNDNVDSHIIATKYFAGGVAGQSFGGMSRIFAEYESSIQNDIEDGLSSFYLNNAEVQRGATNIFYLDSNPYDQMFIGGLIGYVESGRLEVSYSKLNVVSNTADFAGGIIGGIDLTNANTYLAEADLLNEDVFTKYFINEVFATGDIRARQDGDDLVMTAGGIIGASYGQNNSIALLAVNALNYIANYDYQNDDVININNDINISSTIKTNLILGSAFESKDSTSQSEININNFTSFINLIRLRGDNGVSGVNSATVAYYESYTFDNFIATMNLFGSVSGGLQDNTLYENNYVYAISSPINYTSSDIGHTFTQQAFLSSGVWSTGNWTHDPEDLFPSIMYQRVTNYIYLDDYAESVERVFSLLNSGGGSDITIVVRGLASEDTTDEYSHIDLRDYADIIDNYMVSGFSGSIIGGNYYITDGIDEDTNANRTRVRIISDKSFIESTGPGFYMNDVIIEYTSQGSIDIKANTQGSAGLFSMSDLNEATITNLEIRLNSPVVLTEENSGTTSNEITVGLLAPQIINSSITNLTIDAQNVSSSSYLLSTNIQNSYDSISAGIIAGVMNQTSTSSIMQIDGFNLNSSANLVNLYSAGSTEVDFHNLYLGSYFGRIIRSDSALDMQLNLQGIDLSSSSSDTNKRLSVSNISAKNAYIGGYIGMNNGLDRLTLQDDFSTYIDIFLDDTSISVTPTFDNLYTGLIFGFAGNTNINSINFAYSSFDGGLYVVQNGTDNETNRVEITNLYAGGFAGRLESAMTLSNISQMSYEVVSITSSTSVDISSMDTTRDTFDSSEYVSNTLDISGTAKVGIVVGSTSSTFSMQGTGSDFTVLNRNGQTIRLSGLTSGSAVGSVIGESTSTLANSITGTSTINLTSGIVSNAQIVAIGDSEDAEVSVGGIIGQVVHDTTYEDSASARVSVGSLNTAYVGFIGAVYSNIENLNFGGIIGRTLFANSNDSINLTNTYYGGVVKIFGENSENSRAYVGGSVGSLESSQTSSSTYNVRLINSFNYGDVFVEYNEFESLNHYIFGGLLGRIESAYRITASGNYSIVSSHNSRFIGNDENDLNNSSHALFGDTPVSATSGAINNNYYNFAVSLCSDEYGTDIAYSSAYRINGFGYGESSVGGTDGSTTLTMLDRYDEISRLIYIDEGSVEEGHKVNPINLSSANTSMIDIEYKYNGITYTTFTETSTLSTQIYTNGADSTNLENVAIIGNGQEITYSLDDDSLSQSSIINKLSGFSYVSNLVVNLDVELDSTDSSFAGVANDMYDNTMIYGVQVKGTMSIGGNTVKNLAGIVANLYSGRLQEVNTSLDIIYRSSRDGYVYGIADLVNEISGGITDGSLNKIIVDSYSTGSITSYISANLYAFSDTPSTDTFRIDGCYSIAKLDRNDYMSSNDGDGILSVFGVENANDNIINSYFDYNAVNADVLELGTDYQLSTSGLMNNADLSSIYDERNIDFNYGYPTSKIGALKTSSFAEITSSNSATSDMYEYYVNETKYSRLANFETPSDYDSAYFIITNAGVLAQSNSLTKEISEETYNIRNFMLQYDIDLSQSEYNDNWTSLLFEAETSIVEGDDPNSTEDDVEISSFAPIYLDGREKTISGLNAPLFETIGISADADATQLSTIKNLRLTDANVNNYGILAKVIYNTFVTNMTLIGNVSGNSSGSLVDSTQQEDLFGESSSYLTIGALANEAENSNISAITNIVTINVTEYNNSSNILAVGGLVGTMHNSQINYSSNYAPINVAVANGNSEAYSKNYFVGGLVGFVFNNSENNEETSSLRYSYNASSVMAGYANTNSLLTTQGQYYVGGLVGYSSANNLTISGCYNSGAIKSGNKSNGRTTNNTVQGISYGGGIVGHADIVSIEDCYNEGTIEALGASPVTDFRWATNYDLELYQSNQRNVYAYAIGHFDAWDGDEGSLQVYDNSSDSVYMNGSYLDQDSIINSWSWTDISNRVNPSTARMFQDSVITVVHWELVTAIVRRGIRLEMNTELIPDSNYQDASEDVIVTSYNSFGLPTNFILKLKLQSTINYYYGSGSGGGLIIWFWFPIGIDFDLEESYDVVNDEYASIDYSNAYADYEDQYLDGNSFLISNYNDTTIESDGENIKRNTRSNITTNIEDIKVTTIDGISYYLADSDGLNAIFGAGMYNYQITETWDELGLPYVNDRSYYSVSAWTDDETPLSTYVDSVNDEGVTFTVYSSVEIEGNINYRVTLDYDVSLNFNMSSLNYYYIDGYSFGIGINNYQELQPIADYTLIDGSGKEYKNVVVKAIYLEDGQSLPATEEIGSDQDFVESNPNIVYFALQDNMLIYIPNAELNNGRMSTTVNREGVTLNGVGTVYTYNNEDGTQTTETGQEAFNHAVLDIIENRFAGKEYYCTISGLESRYKTVSFGGVRGSADSDSISDIVEGLEEDFGGLTGESEGNSSLSYGQVIDGWYNESTITQNDEGYQVMLSALTNTNIDEAVAINNSGEVVLGFYNNTWLLGEEITISSGGYTYEVSLNDNILTLLGEGINEDDVRSFLESISAIANDFSDTLSFEDLNLFNHLIDNFTDEIAINFRGNEVGTATAKFTKVWSFNSEDNRISINSSGASIVEEIVRENDTPYTFTLADGSSINIYQGEISFDYIQSYYTSLYEMSLHIDDIDFGDTLIYDVSVTTDGETQSSRSAITQTNQAGGSLDIISGGLDFIVGESSTYQIDIYSSYVLGDDVLERFYVNVDNVEDNSSLYSQYVVSGYINIESQTIENIIITFKYEDTYLRLYYTTVYNSAEEEIKIYELADASNNTILQYNEDSGNYTIFYDEDGQLYEPEDTTIDGDITVTIGGIEVDDITEYEYVYGPDSYAYLVDELLTGMVTRNKIEGLFSIESVGEVNYLVLTDNDYDVLEDPIDLENGTSYNNQIEAQSYDWQQRPTYFSEYSTYQIDTDILKDYKDMFNYTLGGNQDLYSTSIDQFDNTLIYNVLLRPTSNVALEITVKDEYSASEELDSDVTNEDLEVSPVYSIVLMNDTMFTNISNIGFANTNGVSIMGNGYYISYYGAPLYNRMQGGIFKDIYFLGENHDTLFLKRNDSAIESEDERFSQHLYNIKLYGSVSDFNKDYGALIDYDLDYTATQLDIISYVSITSDINTNNNSQVSNVGKGGNTYDLKLFSGFNATENDSPLHFTNYGFISASNGLDGENGENGTRFGEDGENGYDGSAGRNIIISENSVISLNYFSNNGIIKAGDGGNGGAGGSGYRAEEDLLDVNSGIQTPGQAGQGGNGGDAGSIILVNQSDSDEQPQESSLSQRGINGQDGARGRYALTKIDLESDDHWYGATAWTTEAGSYKVYYGNGVDGNDGPIAFNIGQFHLGEGGHEALFNNLGVWYTLDGDYATQYPTSDWGGNTYDEIKSGTNT